MLSPDAVAAIWRSPSSAAGYDPQQCFMLVSHRHFGGGVASPGTRRLLDGRLTVLAFQTSVSGVNLVAPSGFHDSVGRTF